jgi:phosphoribosyl-ATP pyrophosphohydrolase/phosphoribosyl-AMP cyclohydrolase
MFKQKKSITMDINFNKDNGLVPAIIQDAKTDKVLMLGYMNQDAYEKTVSSGLVTFYSRSRQCLWTKGETSNNFLNVREIKTDCDSDSLLIKAIPSGPTCHTGSYSCFKEEEQNNSFLRELEELIKRRKENMPENSYTTELFSKGTNKIAQKVGEEAVELIIEAKDNNPDLFKNEAADLLYHLLVLFVQKETKFTDVIKILERRA